MKEELIFSLHAISQDYFTAFGLFTLLYLILKIFIKKPILNQIDEESNKFISLIGLIYLVIYIIGTIVELNLMNEEDKVLLLNRMFGKYWFGYWFQPLLWVAITQLLRINHIRKNIFIRIIFSFLLIFSIEKIVMLTVVFHRDYLPSSWTMYNDLFFYPSNLILSLVLKIIIFLLCVYIFNLIRLKLKNLKIKNV
ncbi:hypothetical protein [Flavobacterium sp. UBA4197]|uniref:hypothetical protein n=1 Tax=Flavobacterium sp. UBA4197 TaxID=1946546 RepID=UPI00257FDF2A|nr:hypothetical protein [Flavobacterium sp. UBA4197]